MEAGTTLGAAQLGVLASIAEARVRVHRRPRVAFLATGDELAHVSDREAILAGRKIASSNSVTLRALIAEAGGEPVDLGITRDDPEELKRGLERGADADLLLTTAGVSVGEHDYVRAVLERQGLTLRFWRVRMRPGAPVGFGLLGGRPWIGLPGNPVSTMVTFELFGRPAIRRMLGQRAPFRAAIPVRTGERISLGPRLQHFLRVTLQAGRQGPVARLTGSQGSGLLTSMARADALLIVPETRKVVPRGARLQAIPLRGSESVEGAPF
jgi:molybdopterin molybdotransferase